jgi:hypothetical protein
MTTQRDPSPLERLRTELDSRGWIAKIQQGGVLYVANPNTPRMNDRIRCDDDTFRWTWGPEIGPAADVPRAADHIVHILRDPEAP